MTDEKFAALVERLEGQARRDPRGYHLRVLLLALLGNAYLGTIALVLLALIAVLAASVMVLQLLAIKLIIFLGAILWMLLKSLWVRIEPPTGIAVDTSQAPELFALIGELRAALQAPPFHQVLITGELNAGVQQVPRFGVFGWSQNYLVIGLPLMKALSREQFKAVLAHEFGHLARGHGLVSNWIYRQRLRWMRLMRELDTRRSRGAWLFKPFLHWYSPYFSAYSYPLARANEFEADATSARLASPRAAATALTTVAVTGSFLSQRYWPQIYGAADHHPQPHFAPFKGFGPAALAQLDEATARQWLESELAQTTRLNDTHPALKDRLAALGETAAFGHPAEGESAEHLLGAALAAVTGRLDAQWQARVSDEWKKRYLESQRQRERLGVLEARVVAGEALSTDEAIERAVATEAAGGDPDSALEQFRKLHESLPDNALVALAYGARLLRREDSAGQAIIESAMAADATMTARGAELLRDYCWRSGRKEEAHGWHKKLVAYTAEREAARAERGVIAIKDRFLRHDLPPESLAALRSELAAIPLLGRAYLVRKVVRHDVERPCYILGYVARGVFSFQRKRHVKALIEALQQAGHIPAHTLLIPVDGANYRFGRKFRFMRGSRVR